MSSDSGSDSGSSSSSYSGYDEAGIGTTTSQYESISSPSYSSGDSSYDYESAAYGITSASPGSGAVDTGDLGTLSENMAATQAAQSYEAPSPTLGDIARSAVDLYTQYSPLSLISRGISSISDMMTPSLGYDYEYAAYAPSMIPGYASNGGLQPELFASQSDYEYAVNQAEKAARSLSGQDTQFLTGTLGDSDAVTKYAPLASYIVSGQTPIESQVNKYFSNIGTTQSPLSSSLETSYNQAKANINNLLGVGSLQSQFGYSTQPYGGLSASNLATNPFNIPYLQQRGLI